MKSSSPPALTFECPANTCSVKVEPDRNMPQMKIGRAGRTRRGVGTALRREGRNQLVDQRLLPSPVV